MMKNKKILGKIISLLLVCSMLLSITGTNTKVLASENTATETQTSNLPWADYKRITMDDFGIQASTVNEGTPYTSSKPGAYSGELDGKYLDVDIMFAESYDSYFMFYDGSDWYDTIRIAMCSTSFNVTSTGNNFTNKWSQTTACGIRANEFFNFKILFDITDNGNDEQTIQIQVYIDNNLYHTAEWKESIDQNFNSINFQTNSGAPYTLRTPEAWSCYQQITMSHFGIEASETEAGTVYSSSQSGTYFGELHGKYVDVDIKFDELYDSYFFFYDGSDWYDDIRIAMGSSSVNVTSVGKNFTNKWSTATACGISANQFFNLKILFDITDNGGDEQTVQIQVYINDNHYYTVAWTESIDQSFNSINFQTNSGASYTLRTPTPEPQSYFKLSDYREMTPYTYPTRSGYVFAGWYTDAQYTTPVESDVTIGQAYAKFVKSDVLTVKCQLPIDANRTEPTTTLRVVTSVDSLDYQYVGFNLEYTLEDTNYQKTFKTKNVYKTIKAIGDDGEEIIYHPDEFSTESRYMMALKINKIPREVYEVTLTLTPYWVTLDGTVVTGTTRNDVVLYPEIMEGGSTFANDNEAYYKSSWN